MNHSDLLITVICNFAFHFLYYLVLVVNFNQKYMFLTYLLFQRY